MAEENRETFDQEIRLDSFFKWVWRGKWLIILLVIVASGVAAMMALRQPELHTATALVEVGRVWGKPLKDIYVTVEIANSPGFIQEVADKAGVKPGQLVRSVQVGAVESGVPHSLYPILIRVTAKTESADESVRLAQTVSDEIVARHEKLFDEAIAPHLERQLQLEQQLRVQSSPSDLAFRVEAELADVKANNSSPTSTERTHLVEKVVPGATTRPDIWRGTATAGLIAAVVGVALACLLGYYKAAPRN
ncbi:MAG: Wzz/FepE/Etk N-terminal domain-containing protein [Acidobacteriota bacterium]